MKPVPLRVVTGNDPGSPYPKCSYFLRGAARGIDVLAAWGIFIAGGRTGAVLAVLYLLLADGALNGQSIGKRIAGVKVVHVPTRLSARFRDSVLRNSPFGLVVLLGMMPEGLGRVAFAAGAVVIGGVEGWKALHDPLGLRLGDVWAQTQVVDGKVVAGAAVASPAADAEHAPGRVMLGRTRREQRCG